MRQEYHKLTIDLSVAQHLVHPIGNVTRLSVQATNDNGETWSTGQITVRKSLTGNPAHAVDFGTTATISAVGLTDLADADIEGAAYVHFVVTTPESASGEIQLHLYATDIGA